MVMSAGSAITPPPPRERAPPSLPVAGGPAPGPSPPYRSPPLSAVRPPKRRSIPGENDLLRFQFHAPQSLVIALLIVAITRVATADQNAIRAAGKGIEHELRIHAAGAHGADHSDIGRVLDARGPSQVRRQVGAPIAKKRHDLGFKTVRARLGRFRFLFRHWPAPPRSL